MIQNWKWIAALALVGSIAGCSGDGAAAGGGGGGGGVITRSVPGVTLGTKGVVSVVFLSGQDRRSRGVGSQIADINSIQLQNGPSDYIPSTDVVQLSPLSVQLDGYTINQRDIQVSLNGAASKSFTEYPLIINGIREVVDASGNTVNRTPANTLAYEAPNPFDIRATAFPGRYTTVQVRLDDKTLKWVPGSNVQFDEDNFTSINYDPLILAIRGHISDYIAFDLTNVPSGERPVVESTGNPAEKVLFSGDGIAISEGLGSSSVFELLDPVVIKSGTISEGPVINGKKALNSYKLDETDPSLSIKTALVGIWRNSTEVISATDTVSMVAFPNSDDNNRQTLVLFKQNSAGKISGMWHGYVDYDATDTTKGVFKLFPIGTLTTGETTGQEVNGTVSNITRANGAVKRADWDATGTLPLNFSFPATGAFSVVR